MPIASFRAVQSHDERDLVEQREGKQSQLNAAIFGKHCDKTDGQTCDDSYRVLHTKGTKIGRTFKASVDNVRNECRCEEAEEPSATRQKVVLIAGIVRQVGWKEQSAKEIKQNRIKDDEEVNRKGPLLDHRQTKLPPPEMNDPEQKGDRPAKVKDGYLRPFRMLDETRKAIQQCRDAQSDNDGDDDPDMQIKVLACLRSIHLNSTVW